MEFMAERSVCCAQLTYSAELTFLVAYVMCVLTAKWNLYVVSITFLFSPTFSDRFRFGGREQGMGNGNILSHLPFSEDTFDKIIPVFQIHPSIARVINRNTTAAFLATPIKGASLDCDVIGMSRRLYIYGAVC